MIVLILLVISSSIVYFAERDVPGSKFTSIPATMWWGIATVTTVGYGDVVPATPTGQMIGGLTAILGIAAFALPTGIIASGFSDELQRRRTDHVCPHCGRKLNC